MRSWYYTTDNKQRLGPVTSEQLRHLALSGTILPDHMIMQGGSGKWVPAAKVNGLFLKPAIPPSQQPGPVPPDASRTNVLLPQALTDELNPAGKEEEILDVLPADDVPTLEEMKTPRRQTRSLARGTPARRHPSRQVASSSSARFQYYTIPLLDLSDLESRLCCWLGRENFNTQVLDTEDGGTLIQVEKQGSWRNLVGMSTALNIVLQQEGKELCVEIGAGKWMDKAAVGVVSLFILWPLAVTAAIGAWDQVKMPERIFGFISDYVHRGSEPTTAIRDQSRLARQQAASGSTDSISRLKELALLRDQGILTEEEFQVQKARLLL